MVAGMGDEVLAFLVTLLLGGTVLLAWWSTAVRERPRVRAVLVQPIRPGVVVAEQVDEAEARNRQREAGGEVVFAEGARETAGRDEEEEGEEEERQEEGGEQGRREAEAATAEEVCNTRQGSAATAAAGAAGTAEEARPEAAEGDSSDSSSSSTPPITIKLKFLNDSQREVRARPSESLGRFKRRHFAEALADNKVVRLIFNGQMLSGDRESLGHYGLFDNCVVHCLVGGTFETQNLVLTTCTYIKNNIGKLPMITIAI